MAPAPAVEPRFQPKAPEKPKPKGLPCRGANLARKAEETSQVDARQPSMEWEASNNSGHQQGDTWEEIISEEYLQRYCEGADLTQVEGLEIRVDSVHQNVEALGRCLPQLLRLRLSGCGSTVRVAVAMLVAMSVRWSIDRPGSDQFSWQAAAAQHWKRPQRLPAAAVDPAEAVAPGAPAAGAAWSCAIEVAADFGTARNHRTEIERSTTLSYVYVPVDLRASWRVLQGELTDELSLEGLTQLGGAVKLDWRTVTLPQSLRILTFGSDFNESLDQVNLPVGLKSLTFGFYFNRSLVSASLPSGLENLTFGGSFNQTLEYVRLPSSLKSLTLGPMFSHSLRGVLWPNTLERLILRSAFRQSLDGVDLPHGLKHLFLGGCFNHSLGQVTLPKLETLTFGAAFNQSLCEVNLPELRSLTLGDGFNQPLDKINFKNLSRLHTLSFGNAFSQSLDGVNLPEGLQHLSLGEDFGSLQRVMLPPSLQTLECTGRSLEGVNLPGLQSLSLWEASNLERVNLPAGLKSLSLDGEIQSLDFLPSGLEKLTFGDDFNQSLDDINLPRSLLKLALGDSFNQSLDRVQWPSGLRSLSFGWTFDCSLEEVNLPDSLHSLTFGSQFNQSLEKLRWPAQLQSLTFGSSFNRSLHGVNLPSDLRSLSFGWDFNQSLETTVLPESLTRLTFGYNFHQSLAKVKLPSGLQVLTFEGNYDVQKVDLDLEDLRYFVSNILCVRDLGVHLHRLQVLWLGRCGLQDLSGIGLMEGLKEFYLPFNDVADVSQLKWLNLQVLDLEGNALADAQDLWELCQCLELRHLTLRGCPVAPQVGCKAWGQLREDLRAQLPHLECLDDEDVNLEVSVFRPQCHRRSKMDPAMGSRLLDHYVQSDLNLYLDLFLEDDLLDRLHEVPSPLRRSCRGAFAEPDEEELVVERLKAAPRGEILPAASPIGSPQAASFGPLHLPPRGAGRESCADDGSLLTRGKEAMAGNVLGALRARRGESDALLDLDIRELLRRCAEPPFSEKEEKGLWELFEANINVNGTGAVIASPGPCPALVECCNILSEMPYGYHWTRDASLSLLTVLQQIEPPSLLANGSDVEPAFLQLKHQSHRLRSSADSAQIHVRGTAQDPIAAIAAGRRREVVEKSIEAFANWVSRSHQRTQPAGNVQVIDASEEAFLEPKWTFDGEPYKGGWCRPQTDGPALRARLMMRAATLFPKLAPNLLDLAKKDLEWLVLNHRMESCDLWEETRDIDFLWNRVVQLSALAEGHQLDIPPWQKSRRDRETVGRWEGGLSS
eukprot:s808_g23.t1